MTTAARGSTASRELAGATLWMVAFGALTVLLVPVFMLGSAKLLLLAILGVPIVLGLFAWPQVGVFVLFLVAFGQFSADVLGSRYLGIPWVVTALLAAPLGAAILRERELWVLRVPQIQLLIAIGALTLLSTWWSGATHKYVGVAELDTTQRELFVMATRSAFLLFLVYFVTTRERIEILVLLVVGMSMLVALDCWRSILSGAVLDRAMSLVFDKEPNRVAFICLFATALVWFFRADDPSPKPWRLPLILFFPATAIATGSRSGLLQTLLLGALILSDRGGGGGRRLKHIFLMGCAALLVVSLVPAPLLQRALTFDVAEGAGHLSLQNRSEQLLAGVRLFVANPLLGVGIGNFESIAPVAERVYGGVHNSYIRALAEGGIGMLVLYLWLFALTHQMLRRLETEGRPDLRWLAKSLRYGLLLYLVSSATGDIWLSETPYVVIGLTIVLARLADPHRWSATPRGTLTADFAAPTPGRAA